ncbi:hypothetical protein H7X87_02325 [Acetobacteraceae bacterium]|nr:hypothetical protein [Candidatus Parcubacteria bacterium]
MGTTNTTTFRLFRKKRRDFLDGYTAILDFSPLKEKYNSDSTDEVADTNSLFADWLAVGSDITTATKEFEILEAANITSKSKAVEEAVAEFKAMNDFSK